MSIKEAFDRVSKDYDQNFKQRFPCFDDYYHLPLTVMDFEGDSPAVLDIGAGTGLFSSVLLGKYPKASITLIDLSDKMLAVARERFSDYPNFNYIVDDYTQYDFKRKYDIIISALSIHHITASQKERLYQKCFDLLNEGGVFVNADIVLSPSPEIDRIFTELWVQMMRKNGANDETVQEAIERWAYDDPSTLEDQLNWLAKAGFRYADSIYKYYHFCVIFAKK